jgi:PAS domain S-box-containing protein
MFAMSADFDAVFRSAPGLIAVLTPDFCVVSVNDAYVRASNLSRADMVGRHLFDLFPTRPDDPDSNGPKSLRASLERVLQSKAPDRMTDQRYDVRGPIGEGGHFEERYWSAWNYPVLDEEGRVTQIVHQAEEVTELVRQRLEKLDRESRLAESILESITDAFFALDREWKFTYVNRQAYRVLGRSPGDLIGQTLWDAYPGLVGSEFEKIYRRASTEGIDSSITSYYPDHDRWYEAHAYPAPHGISIYFRDVSQRVRAEAEINRLAADSDRQRRIYEAALSNTPDLVYVFGLDHRFVYANEALLAMWGRTFEDAIGKNCLELGYEPWHASMHDLEIEQVVASKRPIRGEVPFTGTQGRRIYDYIFVPVIGEDGNVEAVAGTTRDVTERQQAADSIRDQAKLLQENDRRKDEFLAMLAHELRNPLSAVGNAVTVLRLSDDKENAAFARDVIDRQVRHLSRLIDDLLDVSRITSGKIRLRRELIDAGSILKQAVEAVQPLLVERKHSLMIDCTEGNLPLRADPTRVEQIVVNLLNNAAKYTDPGGRIRLSAEREDDYVVIGVQDNGMGIPAEKLPEMFRLFAQGERSIARSEGGLGIGLTLVQKLTEMHGGSVSASSGGVGKGSTFTVRLPAAKSASETVPGTTRSTSGERRGARILVVDDNLDTAKGMVRLLKLLGNEVGLAHDGPSAIEAARDLQPDFVLLDIGLPGMDGYEVAQWLRKESNFEGTIIGISGYGQDKDRRRSREAGFDHHLVKPVDFDSLLSLLASSSGR